MKLKMEKLHNYKYLLIIRNIFLLLLISFISAVSVYAEIRIGSLNANHLGCNNSKDIYKLSKIIDNEKLLVIAIQEVCNEEGVKELLNYLGTGWKYVVSDELGRGKYKERYAFLYREKEKIRLGSYKQWDDSTDEFIREPLIAEFYHENKIYWLINIHIIFDSNTSNGIIQRKNELRELGKVYTNVRLRTKRNNSFTIVLGDFNLTADEINSEKLPFKCFQTSKSTVAKTENKYSNSYDHFCMSEEDYDTLNPKFVRIHAPEKYFQNDFSAYQSKISDHVPIRMDIKSESIFEKGKKLFGNIPKLVSSE